MSKTVKIVVPLSKEYRKGDLHRHHNLDYHHVTMQHPEPLHDHLIRTTYERRLGKHQTRIGTFATVAYKALQDITSYEITHGSAEANSQHYIVGNTKKDGVPLYHVIIYKDGTYSCSCPSAHKYNKDGLPCKHVILIATIKGHEIKF